jgi:hypothetical protein
MKTKISKEFARRCFYSSELEIKEDHQLQARLDVLSSYVQKVKKSFTFVAPQTRKYGTTCLICLQVLGVVHVHELACCKAKLHWDCLKLRAALAQGCPLCKAMIYIPIDLN